MYAIVENGIIINIVTWDGVSDWKPSNGQAVKIPDDQSISINDRYKNGKFIVSEKNTEGMIMGL